MMTWYNPLSWFQEEQDSSRETPLFCANPQCNEAIVTEPVAYNRAVGELYHDFECAQDAIAHRVFHSGQAEIGNIDYLSMENALKLVRKGKLKKASLEGKF